MSKFDIYSKHFLIDETTNMKKILYINALPDDFVFISFLWDTVITENISLPFLEFAENFPKILSKKFLENSYEEIWFFSWPGPFTKMRIISLTINTIKFSYPNIIIRSCHFFEYFKNSPKTPLLEANAKEFLYLWQNNEEVFCEKNNLPIWEYTWIIDTTSTNFDKFRQFIQWTSTYEAFVNNPVEIEKFFKKISPTNLAQPIYIKPPHITYANK